MLFSQGDVADEIFFVIQGGFTKYVDLSDVLDLPKNIIDVTEDAFNVPYVTYSNGSYFGDSDCFKETEETLKNDDREDNENEINKYFRDSTAEADNLNRVSVVMVIKKRHFEEELRKFPQIYLFVKNVAYAKLDYHASLINIIVRKHQDETNL